MLVDIVVRNREVLAAKPTKGIVPPIILVRTGTESGDVLPAIKWDRNYCYNWLQRLDNRATGILKGAALDQALSIVRDNGALDVSGEYGSIDIDPDDFKPVR